MPQDPITLLDNGTFCALPWIHDFRHLDGKKHLCCIAYAENLPLDENFNSESTNELRRKILNGEPIPHCRTCYKQEAAGVKSYRQIQSLEWFRRDAETSEYFANITQDTLPRLFYYDIRFDAKCNLACITCGPQFSTLWKKELGLPIIEYKLGTEFEEMRQAKKIYLAGGEPLIIDEHIALLEWIATNHPEVELTISTNLTGLKPHVLDLLKSFKNLGLVISVDAWGPALEYVRYPLKWEKFITNLESVKSAGVRDIYFNTVASAVSVFGWKQFNQLDQYDPKEWFIYPLEHPTWFQLQNVPDHLKARAQECILPMKESKFYNSSARFRNEIDHVYTTVQNPVAGQDRGWIMLDKIKEIDRRRNINHSDYLGVNLIHNP